MSIFNYDLIIVGCGPAGLTAAIYALRSNKTVLVLEKETIGGQITSSPVVENYPGYKSISGNELMEHMFDQVIALNGQVELEEVLKIEIKGEDKVVTTDMDTYIGKTVIIASGAAHRRLGLENEENLVGNGVSFCVTCDGPFYKDKKVAVIGGGNSAVTAALSLADLANEVIVVQYGDKLTCEPRLIESLKDKKNVTIMYNSGVKSYIGEDEVKGITIENNLDKSVTELMLDGVFVAIGQTPNSDIVKDLLTLNKQNYIVSNDCTTNLPGVFVAGDVREKSVRQLTTAVSDGTIAAINAINYINNN